MRLILQTKKIPVLRGNSYDTRKELIMTILIFAGGFVLGGIVGMFSMGLMQAVARTDRQMD